MQEKAKEVACHIDGHCGTNTLKLEMIGALEERDTAECTDTKPDCTQRETAWAVKQQRAGTCVGR